MEKSAIRDYYEAKLESVPQYEKYTPTNFATFLLEIRDFVMEMPEMMQDDSEMDALMKEGLEDVYSGRKVEGAKKVRKAAEGGSPMAICLLGLHLTANVKSKQDLHLGVGCLYHVQNLFEEVTKCLSLCYDYRDMPATEPDDKEDERYASCYLCRYEDEDGIGRYEWEPFISMICCHGYCIIGSIRINVGWYKEQIEVIEKEGKVDVYAAPYLPVWYVWKTIGEEIGLEKLNDKAGVFLYNEDKDQNPTYLRLWDMKDEVADLTHLFFDGAIIELATGYLFFRTQSVKNLSYELYEEGGENEDEVPVWVVNIPEDWDLYSMKVQYDIARYINNILYPIAQETLPALFNQVRKERGRTGGTCKVVVNDDLVRSALGTEDGIRMTIPFWFIKYPNKFLEEYFLSLDDEELKKNMSMKHCWGQLNSSNTTTMNDRYLESWKSLRKVAYPFLYDDDDD